MTIKPWICIAVIPLLLCSCNGDDSPLIGVNNCDGGFAYSETNAPDSLEALISAFIASEDVSCYDDVRITVEGVSSDFFVIEYGVLQDCPSGCFSSVLCAINDQNGSVIYSARWTSAEEMPSGLEAKCESTAIGGSGDTLRDCEEPPSGYFHPITSTATFNDLVDNVDSLFRHCN